MGTEENNHVNEVMVRINDVSKSFRLPHEQHSGLKQAIVGVLRRKHERGYEVQRALNGVSFEVNKGDFFGIVGRNGSGKSTLLKVLSGIYTPDEGSVEVNGSLVPFIELGVGFNPELTGRENVFLNGALLGFTHKQIAAMYDEIVTFAELEKFMDQKLKNYSSGMQVRLAFSIAIRAESDILVLDEVLAVGDEAFQRKCNDYFNKIHQDKNQTVILVTHSMDAVKKYCNRAILIKDGKIIAEGDPSDIANEYSLENVSSSLADKSESTLTGNGVENLKVTLLSESKVDERSEIQFVLEYDVTKDVNTVPALSIIDIDRNIWLQNDNMWNSIVEGAGHHKIRYSCKLPKYVNDCTLKIQASVWSDEEEILSFVSEEAAPKMIVRRKDVKTKHEQGAATGLIHLEGRWEILK